MATCPHCQHESFELEETSPAGSAFKVNFIKCANCEAPVGVLEYYDTGDLLKEQEAVLAKMEKQISRLQSSVEEVQTKLHSIERALMRR